MLTVSGHTSWKRAFIQTVHTMPRGANVIFICPIPMAMSFHLLVRSSLRAHAPEIPRRACSAISFISGLRLNKTSPLGGKTELTPIFFYEALFVPQTDTDYDAESIASIRAWATLAFRHRRKRRWSGRRARCVGRLSRGGCIAGSTRLHVARRSCPGGIY
jgi:hypothetical protein